MMLSVQKSFLQESVSLHIIISVICLIGTVMCIPAYAYGKDMTVMSFNIRYKNGRDGINGWDNRKVRFAKYIKQQNADIICFQEVLNVQLDYLKSSLKNYNFIAVGVKDGKTEGEIVPVFFRKERYECIEKGTFWLSETPAKQGTKGWDASNLRIATWVKLRDKKTKSVMYVVNTHLDHKGEVARRKGMDLIKRAFVKRAVKNPVVITGDMNSDAKTDVYQIAQRNHFAMYDAYSVAKKRSGVPYSYHAFGKLDIKKRKRIDFVFVTHQFKVKLVNIPKEKEGMYISDHNPVIVKMSLDVR